MLRLELSTGATFTAEQPITANINIDNTKISEKVFLIKIYYPPFRIYGSIFGITSLFLCIKYSDFHNIAFPN
jgi:hypothetical protein